MLDLLLLDAIAREFRRELIDVLLDDDLEVPIFVSELQLMLEDRLGVAVSFEGLEDFLHDLEVKYNVLAVDELAVLHETRLVIGQLNRAKMALLYKALYENQMQMANLSAHHRGSAADDEKNENESGRGRTLCYSGILNKLTLFNLLSDEI